MFFAVKCLISLFGLIFSFFNFSLVLLPLLFLVACPTVALRVLVLLLSRRPRLFVCLGSFLQLILRCWVNVLLILLQRPFFLFLLFVIFSLHRSRKLYDWPQNTFFLIRLFQRKSFKFFPFPTHISWVHFLSFWILSRLLSLSVVVSMFSNEKVNKMYFHFCKNFCFSHSDCFLLFFSYDSYCQKNSVCSFVHLLLLHRLPLILTLAFFLLCRDMFGLFLRSFSVLKPCFAPGFATSLLS